MNAVRYCSKTGNTKKVAEMIADQLGITAESVDAPLEYPIHKLFLGGAIHMATLDKGLKEFTENLDPDQVREVVMFGTSGGVLSIKKGLKHLLESKNMNISNDSLFLHGLVPEMGNISDKQKKEIDKFVTTANR